MSKYYIGLSVTYHDPAIAIMNSRGEILFAEATERYLQSKRALNSPPDQLLQLPALLRQYCPNAEHIVIATNWRNRRPSYENLVNYLGCLKAPGLLKTGIKRLRSPLQNYQLHHMMACQRNSIHQAGINLVRVIKDMYPQCSIEHKDFNHHLTHAATACYSSSFNEAACAVIDSYGEFGAMAFYRYQDGELTCLHESRGTGSLGLYYMKLTELCGFDWTRGEEWKVMGLAPYGQLNEELYKILKACFISQGFRLRHATRYFFANLSQLDKFKRTSKQPPEYAADIAFTGQLFFTELMASLLQHLHETTKFRNLALAGGCALNSSFNGVINQRTSFRRVYVPSAPADDGTALGAAWLACHAEDSASPQKQMFCSPYTGSFIKDKEVSTFLQGNSGLRYQHLPGQLCEAVAGLVVRGKLVGWIQGRAEFGPRALGNRSILADPRRASMKDTVNEKIKLREKFRPFAPAILHEHASSYFMNYQESPYMDKTQLFQKQQQKEVSAVCHVNGTGRVQTVKREWNPLFYDLITCFYDITGVPLLLNTSFNVMGKPIIHSLEDAVAVFMSTRLDVLVVNDYLITKPDHAG